MLTLALTDPATVHLLHGVAAVCEERELGLSLVPRIPGHDAALVRTPPPRARPPPASCSTPPRRRPSCSPPLDSGFRPAPAARVRWLRVWLAEHRGTVLPPISVVALGDE